MRDAPPPEVLEAIVAETLAALGDAATPEAVYARRIAASLTDTVARERARGPGDDAAELARLRGLLGAEGDLGMLNAVLAARLRDGTLAMGSSGVAAHLWATTLAKVAIDQPRYDVTTLRV